jgi:hypothetical protein
MNNTEQAATDSSSPFRLRTAIVIVSMIALPVIAVCGVKLPKFVAWNKSESPATAKTPAAVSRPGVSVSNTATAGTSAPQPPAAEHREQTASHVVAAGGLPHPFDPSHSSFPVKQAANSDVRALDGAAAGFPDAEAGRIYPLPSPTADQADPMPPPAVVAEQFSTIQQRLRALGATHYALETWGPQAELYRFQCRMSAGHHPGYTRQFEAVDDDALRVMQTVLEEIEAWKAGRLP